MKNNLPGLVLVVLTMAVYASAASYTVGDSTGWAVPDSPTFYTIWASSKTFRVGDSLVFSFTTGAHNVMKVTKKEYDACTAVNPLDSYTNGPSSLILNATGVHYYLCSVGPHCSLGQKVAINVVSAVSSSPPPAAPPATPPTSSATPSASSPATPPPSSPSGSKSVPSGASPNQFTAYSSGIGWATLAGLAFFLAHV